MKSLYLIILLSRYLFAYLIDIGIFPPNIFDSFQKLQDPTEWHEAMVSVVSVPRRCDPRSNALQTTSQTHPMQ